MTHWIGLTGGIGSGKTAASDCFMALGVPILDADEISRQMTAKNGQALPQMREVWGDQLFLASGELDRAYLRAVIFSNDEHKKQLEAILHPLILAEIEKRQQQETAAYGIVSVPLLTELPQFLALVERVLLIDCDEDIQIKRVMARSGLDKAQVQAIMQQQASRTERLAIADDVIVNHADIQTLEHQVLQLHQQYQTQYSAV